MSCRRASVVVVPDAVPPERAVLAGTVETAVNALWDAPPLIGDRIAVVGAGVVGCCVARLLAQYPGVEVTLVDINPARAAVAAALGVGFALPADAPGERDLVFHASATSAGLQLVARPLGRRRLGRRPQLVRRCAGDPESWWFISFAAAGHSGQPGRPGARRRGGQSRRRPTDCDSHSSCCATPRSMRWCRRRHRFASCRR